MFVPNSFAVALLMTILSTICWGSFANTYKLTKNYRFDSASHRSQKLFSNKKNAADKAAFNF